MQLSEESKRKLEYLWRDENTVEWIQSMIRIVDKQGNLVPFILTPEQVQFVEDMEKENIVLKSRQLGLSVVVIALSIRACIVRDNNTCVLISHDQKSTNAIFSKLKQQFYSLPDWLKPELLTNNRQELSFVNGSKITCMTAGNKDLLRGETVNSICHLSEFSFWKDPERQMQAINQAISDTGKVIIESTANGYNRFSELYYQAKNGSNSYKNFFFNWINGKTLFLNQYKQEVDKYIAIHGKMLDIDELDDAEKELLSIGASLDQLVWRRKKISEGNLEKFQIEYPSSDSECFSSTGQNLFDTKRIESILKALKDDRVTFIHRDKIQGLFADLKRFYPNGLKIWDIPKPNKRYFLGSDVSEGIGKDYSTAIVLDTEGKVVAQFRNNKIKPYEVAEVINSLGRYYNKALLIVELASGGHSVIERLRYDKKYMNMYKYKTYDEKNKAIMKLGFDTNSKSKSIIVNDAREYFEKGRILINSPELLEEMKTFVSNDNGSMGAISGANDDLVIALCLAITGFKSNVWYTNWDN